MATPTSREVIRESLERHNAAFERLLCLIPSRYYADRKQNDASESRQDTRFHKNVKTGKDTNSKQAVKEASRKGKRVKLDPDSHKTPTSQQHEPVVATSASFDKGKAKAEEDGDASVEDDAMTLSAPSQATQYNPLPKSESIMDLRAKLHARMAELRKGRKVKDRDKDKTSAVEGEPQSKDDLLAQSRRSRELAEKEKEKKKQANKNRHGTQPRLVVPPVNKTRPEDVDHASSSSKPPSQPSFASIQFSSIGGKRTLTSSPSKSKEKEKERARASLKTPNNPNVALKLLEHRQNERSALPSAERKALEANERWEKAEMRLDGEKVRDIRDMGRLKKLVKRGEKEKEKRKDKWEERKQSLKDDQAAREKKRKDNIAMRHDRSKAREKGGRKAPMKSKSRPGFEGAKTFGGRNKSGAGAGKEKVGQDFKTKAAGGRQ